MGSSTRNKSIRAKKIISGGIDKGTIGSSGQGIGNLISELINSQGGSSKIRSELQNTLYSNTFINSFKKIKKMKSLLTSGGLSGLGIGGAGTLSRIEIIEKLCEYAEIDENEILKTSFKETVEKFDILDKAVGIVDFLAYYIEFIILNIIKKFTYEDTMDLSIDFDDKKYNDSLMIDLNGKMLPEIRLNVDKVINEDGDDKSVYSAMVNIVQHLRKKEAS